MTSLAKEVTLLNQNCHDSVRKIETDGDTGADAVVYHSVVLVCVSTPGPMAVHFLCFLILGNPDVSSRLTLPGSYVAHVWATSVCHRWFFFPHWKWAIWAQLNSNIFNMLLRLKYRHSSYIHIMVYISHHPLAYEILGHTTCMNCFFLCLY